MAREPSIPGASRRAAITKRDGTWPLPDEVARELDAQGVPGSSRSGPVEALRARPVATRPVATPAFPRPPRPARPAGMAPAMQDRWYEVLTRHDALAQLDHFAALELPYEAGTAQVQAAFSGLIARFHPDKLPRELELLRPYAVRIVARLNVARMQLVSRRDREGYLRSLGKPIPPSQSDFPPAMAGKAVARVRPERRMVPRAASGPVPVQTRPLPTRPEPTRPERPRTQRDSKPPSAGVRIMRALRGEGSSSD